MDPATIVTIIGWFAQPAAKALFTVAQEYVLQRLGLSSLPSRPSHVEPLLDEYLQKLIARLDEDRIAKLYGAFSKLTDAPRSIAMQGLLIEALASFHEVARIPEKGTTGDRPNSELRCMAFVGMVASYTLLQDRAELIEEKMIEAVSADAATAKLWLGEDLVREILAQLPTPMISCPQCGSQNPAGSRFCNQDGYPLTQSQTPHLQTNPYAPWGTLKIDGSSKKPFLFKLGVAYSGNSATIKKQGRGIYPLYASSRPNWLVDGFTGDFAFQVEMAFLVSATGSISTRGGIFFRGGQKGLGLDFYYFSVDRAGSYSLDIIEGNNSRSLAAGATQTDTNASILLAVLAQGNHLDLYLNHQYLASREDNSSSKGWLGIAVGGLKDHATTEACFDNLMVWAK